MLIDTHAHIQLSQFDNDRSDVLHRAKNAEVEKILVIGFDLETSQKAIELAEKHDDLFATVGVHPHDAKDCDDLTIPKLTDLADHPKVIALGEMGLDYYRNLSPKAIQIDVFERQLDLAEKLDLPIIIHNREAHHDILPILKNRNGSVRGIMHCFSGELETMKKTLEIGFHIGLGGPVTYKKSHELQKVAANVSADRLLIETDCPWLAPQFRRGKRNEPAYVRAVAEKIAELRSVPIEKIAETTTQNFDLLFDQ